MNLSYIHMRERERERERERSFTIDEIVENEIETSIFIN